MSAYDFFILLSYKSNLYILSLAVSIIIFIYFAYHTSKSWLSPIRFTIMTAGIGYAVVIFLYLTNSISFKNFIYVTLSELIFWFTFSFCFKCKQREINFNKNKDKYYAKKIFLIIYILNLIATLYSYSRFGIPIFNEDSRLAVYKSSGGWGIISRFQSFFTTFCTFYIIGLFYKRKSAKCIPIILLIPILLFGILSGSRSSFLNVIFAFWGYKTFYMGDEPQIKNYKSLIIPFIIIAIITFFLQTSNLGDSFFAFYERIVSCGDLYWDSLPGDTWRFVKIGNPLEYIFTGLLGPMRLIDVSSVSTPIGYQFTDIIYPTLDKTVGPVALYPITGLILYGYYGGLLLSFVQSFIASFLFNRIYIKSNSIIISGIAFFAFTELIPTLGDIAYASGMLFDLMINIVLVGLLLLIIKIIPKKRKLLR